MSVKTKDLILLYEGSVKRVWKPSAIDNALWFEYSDDYSVFDWGKMPDQIANKGQALVLLAKFFFDQLEAPQLWQALPASPHLKKLNSSWLEERWQHPIFKRLCTNGASHHCQGLVNSHGNKLTIKEASCKKPLYLQVTPAAVVRPKPHVVMSQTVFDYNAENSAAPDKLVPLEIVFRFGMPKGSSLARRIKDNPDYAYQLGLEPDLKEGEWFDQPILEFFTKLEPKDRLLSLQEALLISRLSALQFQELIERSFDYALGLHDLLAQRGVELWDGKFEFIVSAYDLRLADSIGPDELRLVYRGCQLSKEMIRQVYRGSKWELAIKEAQKLASSHGQHNWKDICLNVLHESPQPLPFEVKEVVDQLYGILANHLIGEKLFDHLPTLEQYVQTISKLETGGKPTKC